MDSKDTNKLVFDALRKLFPEIPERCVWLTITVQDDQPPMLRCGCFTQGVPPDKQMEVEFGIVAKRITNG